MTAFPAPVDAVILDMDGLLLDTERVYRRAFIASAARQGFDMSEDLYQGMVGLADRGSRLVFYRFTGSWPGEEEPEPS